MHGYKWPINCTRTRTGGYGASTGYRHRKEALLASRAAALDNLRRNSGNTDGGIGGNLFGNMWLGGAQEERRRARLRVRVHIIGHARNNM